MLKPIKLLSPWVGNLPTWIDKFEAQMSKFELIDWELIIPPFYNGTNKVAEQLAWFSALIHKTSGAFCPAKDWPIGWCDYRPAFGEAFADHYAGYEYWGYCDPDLLFGDLDNLLPPLLDKCDVLSFKSNHLSGCFTILRNTPEIVSLYRKGNYKAVFASSEYRYWDESGHHPPFKSGFYHTILESGLRIVKANKLYVCDTPENKWIARMRGNKLFGFNEDGIFSELAMLHFMSKIWPLKEDGTSRHV